MTVSQYCQIIVVFLLITLRPQAQTPHQHWRTSGMETLNGLLTSSM